MKHLGAVGLFLGGSLVGWAVALYFLHPPGGSGDSASWVQAVGSIGAIVGAFAVGNRQADSARRHAVEAIEDRQRKRCEAVAAIVRTAADQVTSMAVLLQKMPVWSFVLYRELPTHSIPEVTNAIAAVPLHDLGSYEAVMGLTDLLANLKSISAELERLERTASLEDPETYAQRGQKIGALANLTEFHAVKTIVALGVRPRENEATVSDLKDDS